MASAKTVEPQSWNRYIYCINNPLNLIDPTGLEWRQNDKSGDIKWYNQKDDRAGSTEYTNEYYEIGNNQAVYLDPNGPNSHGLTQEERQGWGQYSLGNSMGECDAGCQGHVQSYHVMMSDTPITMSSDFEEALSFTLIWEGGGALRDAGSAILNTTKTGVSGLGDLTISEVNQIQSVVDQAGRPLEVVGSAARGARTAASDIDYVVPPSSLKYFEGLETQLPKIDPNHGIIPGVGNPNIGPVLRFEPKTF